MDKRKIITEERIIDEKTECLIAIGVAVAANCIPCFEHIYEKAVTSGITTQEIKCAADIAGQVKNGAKNAIAGMVDELLEGSSDSSCNQSENKSCCC